MFFKRKEKKEEPVQEEVVQDTGELLANAQRAVAELKDKSGEERIALLNLYNTKRREAAKAKDDEQIQYYLRKIDEMMAISKEVTRASF